MMSMASSKVNGCGEACFAFGMTAPPSVILTARSSADMPCWHAVPLACSASCYDIVEHIRIVAVVVSI